MQSFSTSDSDAGCARRGHGFAWRAGPGPPVGGLAAMPKGANVDPERRAGAGHPDAPGERLHVRVEHPSHFDSALLAGDLLQERRNFSLRLDQLRRRRQLVFEPAHPSTQPGVLRRDRVGLAARPPARHRLQGTPFTLLAPLRDQRRVQALATHDLPNLAARLGGVDLGQHGQLVLRGVRPVRGTNLRVRARHHSLNGSSSRHASSRFPPYSTVSSSRAATPSMTERVSSSTGSVG